MKDKIFLRIEKGGTNKDYYNLVERLVEELGLSPNKAILYAIVRTIEILEQRKNDND